MNKTCWRCKKDKDYSEYPKDSSKESGVSNMCAECHKEYFKEWADKNKHKRLMYFRAHRNEYRKRSRESYLRNKAPKKKWRRGKYSSGVFKVTSKLYYLRNREKARQYYLRNRKKIIAYSLARYYKNKLT